MHLLVALLVAGLLLMMGLRRLASRAAALPPALPLDRCLLCARPVTTDRGGLYRCGGCGFDVERAQAPASRPLLAALRDLREVREELARKRDEYRSATRSEENLELPRPYLDRVTTLARDLLRDAPALLGPVRPEADRVAAALHGLAAIIVGRTTTTGREDRGDFERQRQQALAQLADWDSSLALLQVQLSERMTKEMRRELPRSRP